MGGRHSARGADTFAASRRAHDGVEVAYRDRAGGAYAQATAEVAIVDQDGAARANRNLPNGVGTALR